MIESLAWSLFHRPYVSLFMVFFLLLSWAEQGWPRTLLWVATSYVIAYLAEWGSINYGIPFGYYTYHYEALSNDLVIMGVPFFDTISFSFLSYVSFSYALFFVSPLQGRGSQINRVTPHTLRVGALPLFLGSILMVVIDWVVDPVANLGRYWFLGDIYHYPDPGIHFGVTFANYCGWFVVALCTLWTNQKIDIWFEHTKRPLRMVKNFPYLGIFSPLFWAGIVLFQLGITFWIAAHREPDLDSNKVLLQAVTGSFILAPIFMLTIVQIFKPSNRI